MCSRGYRERIGASFGPHSGGTTGYIKGCCCRLLMQNTSIDIITAFSIPIIHTIILESLQSHQKPIFNHQSVKMSYTVKAGDTLFAIAQSHGISLEKLQAANPGVDAKNLQVGQVLKLPSSGTPSKGNGYVQYGGPASNFPNSSEWASWDELWKQNERLMKLHDSDNEVALIKKSIEQVAKESGVDRRVILCIIVQESGGNVRVRTVSKSMLTPACPVIATTSES